MDRWSTSKRGLVLAVVFGVVCAMAPVAAIAPADAVPGFPGSPQEPAKVYIEDFQSQVPGTANNTSKPIASFTYPDKVAAANVPYYADPVWTAGTNNCNGWVLNYHSAAPNPGDNCNTNGGATGNGGTANAWVFLQQMAAVLGYMAVKGGYQSGPTDYTTNNAVASQTNGGVTLPGTQGIQAQAANVVMTQAGHFYAVAVDFVEAHCPNDPNATTQQKNNWSHASETLYMQIDGNYVPMLGDGTLNGGINICSPSVATMVTPTATMIPGTSGWNQTNYYYTHLVSMPYEATSSVPLGLRVFNAQTNSTGNDVAFDNVEILDVTPQMDKSFTPATISAGQHAKLTITITNTSDLHKKDGWHFTDTLQPGLTVVPGSEQINGCDDLSYTSPTATDGTPASPTGKVSVSADGTTINVSGNLAEGVASCTVTVEVTTDSPGAYTNGCTNISNLWGINPPGVPTNPQDPTQCVPPSGETLTVETNPHLTLTKTAFSGSASGGKPTVTVAGQKVTYTITITNDGDVPVADLALDDSVFNGKGTLNNDLSCTPVAIGGTLDPLNSVGDKTYTGPTSTTCTVSYNATQADIDAAGTIDNSATASGHGLGTNPGDAKYPVQSNTDSATVLVQPTPPGLTLVKSVVITDDEDGDDDEGPGIDLVLDNDGDILVYTFKVTNTGVTTITNLTIDDGTADSYKGVNTPGFSGLGTMSAVQCPTDASGWMSGVVGALRPGDSVECTATYPVTVEDFNHNGVYNTAQASGVDSRGVTAKSNPSAAVAPVAQAPALTIVKSHLGLGPDFAAVPQNQPLPGKAGDVVRFEFLVTNTGNTDLTEVGVTDTMLDIEQPVECPEGAKGGVNEDGKVVLGTGESIVCSADYVLKQTDIDAGSTVNPQAQAHGMETTNTVDPDTGEETTNVIPVFSPYDGNTVPLAAGPTLKLTKGETLPTGGVTKAGDQVTYSFLIENTGNVTLSNLSISDPAPYTADTVPGFSGTGVWNWTTPAICPSTSLAAGASETCYATYTVTQEDVNLGYVKNTATVTGTAPPGALDDQGNPVTSVTSDPSHVEFNIVPDPRLALTKSANPSTVTTASQQVTYSFLVKNTGNVTMDNLTFQDGTADSYVDTTHPGFSGTNSMSAVTCPTTAAAWQSGVVGSLSPNDTITCTATYSVTQDDINVGVINNTATVKGDSPNGTSATSNPSPATVNVTRTPSLSLNKYSETTAITTEGQTIVYKFDVTNNGNVTVTGLHVNENYFTGSNPLSAVTCPAAATAWTSGVVDTLNPGETIQCTVSYTTTQADVDSGSLRNSATASGTSPTGSQVDSNPSQEEIPVTKSASLLLDKSVTPTDLLTVGEVLTYSFEVTNIGNVTLTNLQFNDSGTYVDDTMPGFNGSGGPPVINCPTAATAWQSGVVGALRPLDTITCTATYTVIQADVDRGVINNAAVATADDPDHVQVESNVDAAKEPTTQAPQIKVEKADSASGSIETPVVGQSVTYSYLVKNTGNVTLANVTVTDPMPGLSSVACPATAAGWPSGVIQTLHPAQSITCSATYTLTQDDIDSGSLLNTGTATGDPPNGPPVDDSDPHVVTITQTPQLTLQKSASPTTVTQANTPVTYSFKVTNDGDVTITNIMIDETSYSFSGSGSFDPDAITCEKTTLQPDEWTTCTSLPYLVTQTDIDTGSILNTATATGKDPTNAPVVSNPSPATVYVTPGPALSLVKSASPTTVAAVGGVVNYTFTVTNNGNETLHDIAIDETAFSGTGTVNWAGISCDKTTLAPGDFATCTAPAYAVTQPDLDAGVIDNTAKATGTGPITTTHPQGVAVESPPDSAEVIATQSPALTLDKSASPATVSAADQTVAYSFRVTNTGNVTVKNISINEKTFTGKGTVNWAGITCDVTTLAPLEFATCTAPLYSVTQLDMDTLTTIDNTATAKGTTELGTAVESAVDSAQVTIDGTAALTLVKTASPSTAMPPVNGQITYSFLVTNTGTQTIDNIAVTDTHFDGAGPLGTPSCLATTLPPGGNTTCTVAYTVKQADVDAGILHNTAEATGSDPQGGDVTSNESSAQVPGAQTPSLTLIKSATPTTVSASGQTVNYLFQVTNDGNVTVHSITIDETSFTGTGGPLAITCPSAPLQPNTTVDCTATYQVTQPDIEAGVVLNTAIAKGLSPSNAEVDSNSDNATVTAIQMPSLDLVKSALPTTVTTAGQTINYKFVVTNNGNETIDNITIADPWPTFTGKGTFDQTKIVCDDTSLAPDESTTCRIPYTVVQQDIDAGGTIDNTATATGDDPTGDEISSEESSSHVQVTQSPALTLVKTAAVHSGAAKFGATTDQIDYTFEVTNTGNVTVKTISIADGGSYSVGGTAVGFSGAGTMSQITCDSTTLAPDASTTCHATYGVTQADIDAGGVYNTAKASGTTDTAGPVNSSLDTAQVLSDQLPALQITKTHQAAPARPMATDPANNKVTFEFTVTNNGNTTITGMTVADVLTGHGMTAVTCGAGAASMAPLAQVQCSAVYTLTQVDIDAGFVDNPTAQASGRSIGGSSDTLSNIANDNVPLSQQPALKLDKSVTPTTVTKPGAVLYSFKVTNTGNVTVTGITINETMFTGSNGKPTIDCPDDTLIPGAFTICTATYQVSQADMDTRIVDNTAKAEGLAPPTDDEPGGPPVVSEPSSAQLVATQKAALSLLKTGTPSTMKDLKVGTVVTYSFLVTNTGNVTLTGIYIKEQVFTGSDPLTPPTCPTDPAAWTSGQVGTLAPGDQITCTTPYRVTQEDVDNGSFINTAIAKGKLPLAMQLDPESTNQEIPSNPSTFPETLDDTSTVGLVKSGVLSGTTITWTYVVTNTGVTDLTDLKMTEAQFSGKGTVPKINCPKTTLAPAEKMTCTATYQLVAGDKGTNVVNTGQVDGLGAHRTIPVKNTATAQVAVPAGPPAPMAQTGGSIVGATAWPYAMAGALVLTGLAVIGFFLWRRRRS